MALAYDANPVTRNADAGLVPHGIVHEEAMRVAGDLGLHRWWLSEQARPFFKSLGSQSENSLPTWLGKRARWSRSGDRVDVLKLVQVTGHRHIDREHRLAGCLACADRYRQDRC
jgi:hypothetical protein